MAKTFKVQGVLTMTEEVETNTTSFLPPKPGQFVWSYINWGEGWDPYLAIILRVHPEDPDFSGPVWEKEHRVDLAEFFWDMTDYNQSYTYKKVYETQPNRPEMPDLEKQIGVTDKLQLAAVKYINNARFLDKHTGIGRWRHLNDEDNGAR